MVLADTTFLDVFWYSILFFFWIMAIWIFIALISDVIRRDDLSGGGKAAWIVFMIILVTLIAVLCGRLRSVPRSSIVPFRHRNACEIG